MKIVPRKYKVALVIQNAWDTTQLTMPLALGYLKSFALADDDIREHFDIEIINYSRRASVSQMAIELFENPPDILGFSVLGWNFTAVGELATTYHQVKPNGWCLFGGNHASHQADRVFRLYPHVDMIINGEGELTFRELLLAFLAGKKKEELREVQSISVRCDDGTVFTTPERPRLKDLNVIPSPFLTGAIEMYGKDGKFLYDVALMETNRGCPYKCAFCYWGGATGSKLSRFSSERVCEELDFFAHHKVENIALCDANFGMLKEDLVFVDHMIKLRKDTTYPRSFVTSWAKNKSRIFYEIVRRLKATGFHSDFTLSLQTLNSVALTEMERKNMKVNDFDDLCRWLEQEEMSAHVELIWGLPGETVKSFLEGYDAIAEWHPRIATYPLCILPNTGYHDKRDQYDMITVRDNVSDYEFVLSHSTISVDDNRSMHRFLFWARLMAEYQVLRHVWRPLRKLCNIKQSEIMKSLDKWFSKRTDPTAKGLEIYLRSIVDNFDITRITGAVTYVHQNALELEPLFAQWWKDEIRPRIDDKYLPFFDDLYGYDWAGRPRWESVAENEGLQLIEIEGETFYGPLELELNHDVEKLMLEVRDVVLDTIETAPTKVTFYFRTGFDAVADSHEFVPRFVGHTKAEIEDQNERRRNGMLAENVQPHVVGLGFKETPVLTTGATSVVKQKKGLTVL